MTQQQAAPVRAAIAADWRDGVVYQIYPRSFADHDGDGTGDLRESSITSITSVPMASRSTRSGSRRSTRRPAATSATTSATTTAIDPLLGTDSDFDELVEACHRRGIKVVLDLVMNHTSDEHAWFQASKQSRDGPVRRFLPVARPLGPGC